ncbi:MAG: flippase [Candidatus Hadarchaeales archaeon]
MSETIIYAKRLLRGSSLIFLSGLSVSAAGFLLRIFLARSLMPSDYGLFFALIGFLSFVALVGNLGLPTALTKYISEFWTKKQSERVRSCIYFALKIQSFLLVGMAVSLVLLSNTIAVCVFKTPEASTMLKVMSVWLVVGCLFGTVQSAHQGFQNLGMVSLMGSLQAFGILLFALLFIGCLNFNVTGMAFACLFGSLTALIIGVIVLIRKYWIHLKGKPVSSESFAKGFIWFSLISFIGIIGVTVLDNLDTLIIQLFRGAKEVGYYQVARPLFGVVGSVGGALGTALFPLTSELWAREERESLRRLLRYMLKISFSIILPTVFLFVAFPEIIIRLIFGDAYLPAAPVLRVLAIVPVFYIPWMYLQAALGGIGRPDKSTQAICLAAAINLVGNLLLVKPYGALGAAVAMLVMYGLGFTILVFFTQRFLGVDVPMSSIGKSSLGGCFMLMLIFILKGLIQLPVWLKLVTVLTPSLLFYLIWEFATKVITREDLALFRSLLRRH